MDRFFHEIIERWEERPFVWTCSSTTEGPVSPPGRGAVLVLGPHPDDPESAAVTCRLLRARGCSIFYAIASLSPEGVEDRYIDTGGDGDLNARKAEIRRAEQIEAARAFGLELERLTFLELDRRDGLYTSASEDILARHLDEVAPDLVILPVGRDTNHTHQWVFDVFRRWAQGAAARAGQPIAALYNEDPKTTAIRDDLFVPFDENEASWKRGLLRVHDTQQKRNENTRSIGFDDRILAVNLRGFERMPSPLKARTASKRYAEVFELEVFGEEFARGVSHERQVRDL